MPANARAFLLLAAGLTATGARRKRNGVLAEQQELHIATGLPATLNPSPAAGRMCPVRPPWHQGRAVSTSPVSPDWCSRGTPGNADAGISRVYVFALREIRRAIQYCPVRLSYNQCGPVLSSTV